MKKGKKGGKGQYCKYGEDTFFFLNIIFAKFWGKYEKKI